MPQIAKGARLYLYRRKGREPIWIIRDGARQVGTGCGERDLEGAEKALSEYLTARFRPDTGQRDLARIRVAEVLMLYGQDIAPTKASAATIGYHMKALLPFWGEKTLADVKGSTCRKYLEQRTNAHSGSFHNMNTSITRPSLQHRCETTKPSVKPSTVRRELKTLQAAINHWHRESPLAAVPKVTLPEEGARRERVLERNEVAAMLRAARRLKFNHVARFILIGVYTGTRHNAILRLRWVESLDCGFVDLQRGIMYRRGSAQRETSKRRPPVSIPAKLAHYLKQCFDRDAATGNTRVIYYNGQAIRKMKRAWAHVVKEAGLGKDVTPHVLRHSCASHALWGRLAKGARPETKPMTIWQVAGLIGADASTVERTYGHHQRIDDERKRA